MARIIALSKYGTRAASTRQRLLQFAPFLAEHGIEIEIRPLLDDTYLDTLMKGRVPSRGGVLRAYAHRLGDLFAVGNCDAVWVQYELFPYLPLLDRVMAGLSSKPVIYDIDDAIFHMYDAHRSAAVRRILGGKLRPVMRGAAVCLCGNAYLRDYVEAAGGRARIVPTVVDTHVFSPGPRVSDRPLTIGWIGSPSTWTYVKPLLPTIMPAIARLGANFRVIGAGPAARGIDGIETLEWSEAREVADLQAMDIGIMPLPDEAWTRGKCGYKLIQYMACGLPTIASPIGVNATIVEHDINGYLAANSQDWVTALETMAHDAALRRRMGEAGRAKVVADYSLASQKPVVLDAFRMAIGMA